MVLRCCPSCSSLSLLLLCLSSHTWVGSSSNLNGKLHGKLSLLNENILLTQPSDMALHEEAGLFFFLNKHRTMRRKPSDRVLLIG